MRKRTINYQNKYRINVFVLELGNYPAHWHDALEIFFVLSGKVSIRLGTGTHVLEKNDFAIVNPNEMHQILSENNQKSKVLLIQIDAKICTKFCDDIYADLIHCYSSLVEKEYEDNLMFVRQQIAQLVWRINNYDDNDEKDRKVIEYSLKKFILYLLDNFNIASVMSRRKIKKEDFKNSEVVVERYRRIFKYLYTNFKSKINLSVIASNEKISLQYLSSDIKDKLGMTFQEILNILRVEESEKLLLGTNMNILDIAYECGFSDPKYLDKNFYIYYGMTPSEYRKKNIIAQSEFKGNTVLEMKHATEMIDQYLGEMDEVETKMETLNVNFESKGKIYKPSWRKYINLGNSTDFLRYSYNHFLEKIQSDVGFEHIRLDDIFKSSTSKQDILHSWRMLMEVIELQSHYNTKPIIVLRIASKEIGLHLEMLQVFLNYSRHEYGIDNISQWIFELPTEKKVEYRRVENMIRNIIPDVRIEPIRDVVKSENYLNDTIFMVPYILHNAIINDTSFNYLQAIDYYTCEKKTYNENYIFYGGNGLMTSNGLKKASYYAFHMLSSLGDEVLDCGEGFVVTRKGNSIQLLVYNYDEKSLVYNNKSYLDIYEQKEIRVKLKNVNGMYRVTRYNVSSVNGSIHYHWVSMGEPSYLSNKEIQHLDRFAGPNIAFELIETNDYALDITLEPYGAEIIIFDIL